MSKTLVNILKTNSTVNSFEKKARLLGLDIYKQAEMLTKMYEGKLEFRVNDENKIEIIVYSEDINVLEIPDIENLDTQYLLHKGIGLSRRVLFNSLKTIKLPKSFPELDLSRAQWLYYVDRIFMWDTTPIVGSINDRLSYNMNKPLMIIVQSSTGGKSKIYNL